MCQSNIKDLTRYSLSLPWAVIPVSVRSASRNTTALVNLMVENLVQELHSSSRRNLILESLLLHLDIPQLEVNARVAITRPRFPNTELVLDIRIRNADALQLNRKSIKSG